ncbi:phosphatase PAP2 family protein [Bailinhaonella thermotolerans]|uniref:Phosphatase PAP2 family protein n=1 Tax=Bailinhaonella thermotolerans TaxID=1070861 RepID=A0A3A4AZT0_9ACTN|nr:phosphatase PAP2 family protein [Bailinhaonella thermotolerans]RJL31343.1 phosphatase PAP2 family protein [Bailinhaonella thermotolerans]
MDLLDGLREAEIDPIVWIQGWGAWLEPVMETASFFGTETFFLVLLPVLYWCVSPAAGLRVGLIVLVAGGLNAVAKLAAHAPRPYWIDPRVLPLSAESSFGMPSGHAQLSANVWGAVAALTRRRAAWAGAASFALVIGLSRIYLGVHFISDVIAGFALGLLTLWAFLALEERAVAWWRGLGTAGRLALAAGVSWGLILAGALALAAYEGWRLPATWTGAKAVDPESLESLIAMGGALFGMLAGAAYMDRLGWFDASGPLWRRLLRLVVGAAGVAVIYAGLKAVLPDGDSVLADVLRYARYALLTLWVQLGAPLLFLRLGLVGPGARSIAAEPRG